jgi:PAS domain-containing protein
MSDSVFISDAEGNFVNFNDAFVTYHRFKDRADCSKSIFTCSTLLDVWFTETGEIAKPEMWAVPRALRGESAKNFEYTLKRRDTGETWIGSYNFAPIRNNDGAIVGSVVTASDITERKRAEKSLKKANERFDKVLNTLSDEFAVWDKECCYTFVNEAGLNAGKRTREQLIGRNCWEVFPEAVGSNLHKQFLKTMEDGIPHTWIDHSPVTGRWIEYRLFPLDDGIASITRDITERNPIAAEASLP